MALCRSVWVRISSSRGEVRGMTDYNAKVDKKAFSLNLMTIDIQQIGIYTHTDLHRAKKIICF